MYCSECGNKLNDEAKFCINCGAETINAQGENRNVPAPQYVSHNSTTAVSHNKNIKLFWGVGVAVLIIILLFIGKGALESTVKQSTPVEAVQSFFKMIDKENVEGFKKLISPKELMMLKLDEGYTDEMIDDEIENLLAELRYGTVDEIGTDWIEQVIVLGADNYSDDYYQVEVSLFGEIDYVDVIRVGKKYYIDLSSF